MASFQERVIGALKLQAPTFEEVEQDATSMSQAAIVVVAAAISGALGAIYFGGLTFVVYQAVFAIIGWVVGAFLVWIIGTKVIPGKNTQADVVQVLRPVGFAQAPGIFAVVGIIPILGWLARIAIVIWTIVATVVAVRVALDYEDNVKAAIVCILAWVAGVVVTMVLAGIVGFGAVGSRMF